MLVATSVIGTGISLDGHFTSYFGIIVNRIITVADSMQMIGRVRLIRQLAHSEQGQSYLYIQKGGGRELDYRAHRSHVYHVAQTLLKSSCSSWNNQHEDELRIMRLIGADCIDSLRHGHDAEPLTARTTCLHG